MRILMDSPGLSAAVFAEIGLSSNKTNVPCEDYSLCAGRLEIRKPAQRGRFQKLEMRDLGGELFQAPLAVGDLGAEQVLMVAVERFALQIFSGNDGQRHR